MRIRRLYFFYIITFLFSSVASLSAQVDNNKTNSRTSKDSISVRPIRKPLKKISKLNFSLPQDSIILNDSLIYVVPRDQNGLIIGPKNNWVPFDEYTTFLDTVLIEPAFLPVVFDGKLLPEDLNFLQSTKEDDYGIKPYSLISADSTFQNRLQHVKKIEKLREGYYTSNVKSIKLNALAFTNSPVIEQEVVDKRNPFQRLISADKPIDITTPELEKVAIKQKYWLITGEHNLQFSINQFTDNWSGGDNNYSLKNYHKFTFNYKKKRLGFTNTLEWRLNLIRTESDASVKHPTRVTDDYLRTYSTVGIDAYKNWAYSSNIEIKTPLFNRYNANDDVKTRAIFSPLEVNVGLGMRYSLEKKSKINKYQNFKLTADLSLLSVNYIYVADDLVNKDEFKIKDGDKHITNYGSAITLNTNYNFNKTTGFTSRLKYFTSYSKVQIEFENTLNYKLNNYFSTQLYFYMKYNDEIPVEKKDDKWGYFSANTMLSFGLAYTW